MLGAALLCCLLLCPALGQECKCDTLFDGKCNMENSVCSCTMQIGPETKPVDCTKLVPKCFLMKKESLPAKMGKRPRPVSALVDNDGLYNPDCNADGTFKAKQCNGTDTCWCVNSAGVRRTDKGSNATKNCLELVRTHWVIVEMKFENTDGVSDQALEAELRKLITSRYKLPDAYIKKIEFDGSYIYVDLNQTTKDRERDRNTIDVADVGYYMEKDIKGDNLMNPDNKFVLSVNGKNVILQEPIIMYVDEKPHEISMKHLTPGVIAVIVVVVVAIVAGIVVLVLTRRKRGKYEKAEMKEMNEMQKELNS